MLRCQLYATLLLMERHAGNLSGNAACLGVDN
jgi:hypothetical protein